jgi:hypothetical protein
MKVKNCNKLYLIFFALGMWSCAQITTPQGGPKDSEPPKLVQKDSDKNYQTNFTSKKITLTFNEWIKINNPIKEIAISPPTDYPPKITEKGRSVILEFSEKEILKENTTYQINYGDAIRDFTEGNIYKNLVFIFSTGDVIDSLAVKGTVINSLTKKPQENAIVSLYDNLNDTAFVKSKPLYFTKTNKKGEFRLSNLRSDTFQIFALVDKNVNYFYDQPDEEIAFIDGTIFVENMDTLKVDLEIFDEEDTPRFIEAKQKTNGLVKLVYTPTPRDFKVNIFEADKSTFSYESNKDTIYIWHNLLSQDSININISNAVLNDTITIKKSSKNFDGKTLQKSKEGKANIKFHKNDSLVISFNRPLASFNPDSLSVYDTLKTYNVKEPKIDGRNFIFKIDSLQNSSNYSFDIYPSAFTDIFGNSIKDTISQSIATHDPDLFGKIELDIIAPQDTQYIIKFRNKTNTLDTFIINTSRKIVLNRVEKGLYNLEIIEDINANNYWSSGNLSQKMHPERIKEIPLEELKAGWDLNLTIDIKSIFNEATIK